MIGMPCPAPRRSPVALLGAPGHVEPETPDIAFFYFLDYNLYMNSQREAPQETSLTSSSAETLADRAFAVRFQYYDPGDPLLDELLRLAQKWAESGAGGKPTPGEAAGGLSPDKIKAALAELPRLDINSLLRDDAQLPPMPQVLEELRRITEDDAASLEAIGAVILKDSGLAAFLLRMVNSVFYSFSTRVDTVSRAVGIIGVKPLYSLALGFVFSEVMSRLPKDLPDLDRLWRHSLAVAIAAQSIWEAQEGREGGERLFVAGLLRDVGKLALICEAPKAAHILYSLSAGDTPIHELEDMVLGFNHTKAGGLLLKKWNMPASLITAVQWHHNPYHAAHYKEPAVVHLADVIVHALGLGVRPGTLVPAPARHGATPYPLNAGTLELVAEALAKRLEEAYAAFRP